MCTDPLNCHVSNVVSECASRPVRIIVANSDLTGCFEGSCHARPFMASWLGKSGMRADPRWHYRAFVWYLSFQEVH